MHKYIFTFMYYVCVYMCIYVLSIAHCLLPIVWGIGSVVVTPPLPEGLAFFGAKPLMAEAPDWQGEGEDGSNRK